MLRAQAPCHSNWKLLFTQLSSSSAGSLQHSEHRKFFAKNTESCTLAKLSMHKFYIHMVVMYNTRQSRADMYIGGQSLFCLRMCSRGSLGQTRTSESNGFSSATRVAYIPRVVLHTYFVDLYFMCFSDGRRLVFEIEILVVYITLLELVFSCVL